jgi:hypothetical protein
MFAPLCFLEKTLQVLLGKTEKQVERLFFCNGIIERTQV